MLHKVVFRQTAEADLDSIYEFIARDSPENAINFVRRIRAQCEGLRTFPKRGTLRNDLGPGLRTIGHARRAVIVFRVLKTVVRIVHVYYGGRDLERLLKGR